MPNVIRIRIDTTQPPRRTLPRPLLRWAATRLWRSLGLWIDTVRAATRKPASAQDASRWSRAELQRWLDVQRAGRTVRPRLVFATLLVCAFVPANFETDDLRRLARMLAPDIASSIEVLRRVGDAEPVVIGYYDMGQGQGVVSQRRAIQTATELPQPLRSRDLTIEGLDPVDVLFVQNSRDSGYDPRYAAALEQIEIAVGKGMRLILHDRRLEGVQAILPEGGPGDRPQAAADGSHSTRSRSSTGGRQCRRRAR